MQGGGGLVATVAKPLQPLATVGSSKQSGSELGNFLSWISAGAIKV